MSAKQDDPRDPIEKLAEKFLAEIRAGKPTSVEDFQQRYPKHAAAIEAIFPTLMMMEDIKPDMRRLRDSADTLLDRNVSQLGDFRILRKIGFGGMGVVYEAQQQSLDRPVAIKVFAPTLLTSPRQIRRFKREAKAAGTLHHSNIVPVLGVGEQWGIHYYIMQLIDGKGLDQVIDIHGQKMRADAEFSLRADWPKIATLGRQIASALRYAHSRDILHRDIKPANLLLDRTGTAWIADFGLAKMMSEEDGATKTGQMLGTLRYMSPEQLQGKEDARSDIYSLGLTLYELLTWRRAFDETDQGSLLRQKTNDVPPSPRSIDKTIPRDLETIVLKAMAREPQHRYKTAGAMEEDLDRFLNDEPILARRISSFERFARWSRRNKALSAACACVVLLTASVLGLSLWGAATLQRALDGERLERVRATATSTLATGALDSVFSRFGIEPISGVPRTGEPMLSSEAAALLENLLQYYEQLAIQDANSPELMLKAATAQATIGNIRERLGDHGAAIQAYRSAIAKHQQLPDDAKHRIALATLHNQLGYAYRLHGDSPTGVREHDQAQRLLGELSQELDPANPEENALVPRVRFELARTHYLQGTRIRPGMGPRSLPPSFVIGGAHAVDKFAIAPDDSPANQSLDLAIHILENEAIEAELPPVQQQLLARCLRERVHDNLVHRAPQDTRLEDEAMEILERLVEESPDNLDYRFDLVESLGEFSVFANALDISICATAERRLRRAISLGSTLVVRRPDVAAYKVVLAHAHFKLATILDCEANVTTGRECENRRKESTEHLSSAIDLMSELIVRFPNASGFIVWRGFFQAKQGQQHALLEQPELAIEDWQQSRASLDAARELTDDPIVDELGQWVSSLQNRSSSQHER
jgi:serine/threonine protein kinase